MTIDMLWVIGELQGMVGNCRRQQEAMAAKIMTLMTNFESLKSTGGEALHHSKTLTTWLVEPFPETSLDISTDDCQYEQRIFRHSSSDKCLSLFHSDYIAPRLLNSLPLPWLQHFLMVSELCST